MTAKFLPPATTDVRGQAPGYQKIKHQSITTKLLVVLIFSLCLTNWTSARSSESESSNERFAITLSTEAQAAIKSGVTLSFKCELAVRRPYGLFAIVRHRKQHQFLLSRYALFNQFIVKRDELDTPHIFRSIPQATNYIAAQALMLLESHNDPQTPYSMRLSLSKFDLPGPMRLNAFIAEAWNLDTGWITWQSAN